MYDVIKPGTPPDEAIQGEDFDDGIDGKRDEHNARREAIAEWEDARDRIIDAVRGFTEEVDDEPGYYHVRAVVPFRVRAYKHELDAARVEEVESKYGTKVRIPETDGFVDIESDDTFRAIPFDHRAAYPKSERANRDTTRNFAHRALESNVFNAALDGIIQVPITVDVLEERLVDLDGDVTTDVFDPSDYRNASVASRIPTETVEVSKRVGTATYDVDGVVPPEECDGGDE